MGPPGIDRGVNEYVMARAGGKSVTSCPALRLILVDKMDQQYTRVLRSGLGCSPWRVRGVSQVPVDLCGDLWSET